MSLKTAKTVLIQQILADWDGTTTLAIHVHDWFDSTDPFKYGLVSEARGQWFRPDQPITYRIFARWANDLNIELPSSPVIHRAAEKRTLLSILLRDWDQRKPLADHVRDWQDLADPLKYQLVSAAMGQRFKVAPIPLTTIQQWIRQFKIEVPVSRRTTTPSRRTLMRWKKDEERRRTDHGGPRPYDTS